MLFGFTEEKSIFGGRALGNGNVDEGVVAIVSVAVADILDMLVGRSVGRLR